MYVKTKILIPVHTQGQTNGRGHANERHKGIMDSTKQGAKTESKIKGA